MTNFNPINFINRLLGNQQNQSARADSGRTSIENLPPSANQPSDNVIFKRIIQGNQLQNAVLNNALQRQAASMESAEKTALMKELLRLPNELKEFLQQQNIQSQSKAALEGFKDLSATLAKLNIAQLSQLLGDNSKAAQQRLMQIIVEISRQGGGDIKQLKEIMAMFTGNTSAAALANEANQALKNLILLYLPWVPLKSDKDDPIDFDLDFFEEENLKGEDGQESTEVSQSVNVLIRTKNYGNISAYLQLTMPNNLDVLIHCSKDFPKQMLEKLLAEEAKDINLNSSLVVETTNQVNPEAAPEQANSQKVKISANSNVNSYLLLITYSLIRLVIGIDKGFNDEMSEMN